jgi:hypothetical protein
MAHLTPEQFVDLAEGAGAESAVPHLAGCDACRRELADLRAMLSEAAVVDAGSVPEPSPLFWNQLSSRVREDVASAPAGWRGWLSLARRRLGGGVMPRVLVPALAGALALLFAVIVLPRTSVGPATIPSTPLPVADATVPALAPVALGTLSAPIDDDQLRIVAAVATTAAWDEMMDEIAMAGGSGDALAGSLTPDEQLELQRLLIEETAQARAQEKRS